MRRLSLITLFLVLPIAIAQDKVFDDGFEDCLSPIEDYEAQRGAVASTCEQALLVGQACGDTWSGYLCPVSSFNQFATQSGRQSQWFRSRALECDDCPGSIEHRLKLSVPIGTDYDLFVYSSCLLHSLGSSESSGATEEQVVISRTKDLFSNESFDYWVEVRHINGKPCEDFKLTFEGRQ